MRAPIVAAVSPVVRAALSSSAALSLAPMSAARVAPAPLRASSAETSSRPAVRTAKTATRAARPTTASAAGTPVTSRPPASSDTLPPATTALPSAQVWPEAISTTAEPHGAEQEGCAETSAGAPSRGVRRGLGAGLGNGYGSHPTHYPLPASRGLRRAARGLSQPVRGVHRAQHRRGLVAALGVLGDRVGVGDDARARLDVRGAVPEQGRTDRDGGVGVAERSRGSRRSLRTDPGAWAPVRR